MTVVNRDWAVPFNRPHVPSYESIASEVREALASGALTKGPRLASFENAAAAVFGTSHAVGVSSCTSGLMLVLRSLAHRDGRRQVILPSFNFLAAPAAVVWAGLEPIFVDVDPATFTLDPNAVERAMSPQTAAILGCHTFGCPCDTDRLAALADPADIPLVIDAAHGFGSERDGRQVGGQGFAQVFSLSPTKLVVAGEGGLVATDSDDLAEALRVGREYGNDGAYGCATAGLNARMPEISAALARASLDCLPETVALRRATATAYREALSGVRGVSFQVIPASCASSWKDFCVAVDPRVAGLTRDELRGKLADADIDTRAYYAPACHQMEAFASCPTFGALPVTERLAATLLALPIGSHVTPNVAVRVAETIKQILTSAREPVSA